MEYNDTGIELSAFLTIAETARELGMSRKLVYSMAKEGKLPALQFSPRSIRVSRAELSAWIRERIRRRHTGT